MKKELKIFLIILVGWLLLLNFAILRTVIIKYISNFNGIISKNLVNGAVIFYPVTTESLISVLIIPLFVFNFLVIIFLSLSYYFWKKRFIDLIKVNNKKLVSGKKAQAAMEFLMTYGWAVLAFIVSITALVYFGVLDTGNITGKSICALSPGFNCKEFQITDTGVIIRIQNNFDANLLDVSVNITNSPQGPCYESAKKDLKVDEIKDFFIACNNIKGQGTRFKGDIEIKYIKEGTSLRRSAAGVIGGISVGKTNYTDNDNPVVEIYNPSSNQQINGLLFDLVYAASDFSLDKCWYKLDTYNNVGLPGCNDISGVSSITLGQHSLTVYANDTSGNVGSAIVSFTTNSNSSDSTKPIIDILSLGNYPDYKVTVFYGITDNVGLNSCYYNLTRSDLPGCMGSSCFITIDCNGNNFIIPDTENFDKDNSQIHYTLIISAIDTSGNFNSAPKLFYFEGGGPEGGDDGDIIIR